MTYCMPPEWAPHDRTWMAFPTAGRSNEDLDEAGLDEMRRVWADVAHAIARFEPVSMAVHPRDVTAARAMLGDGVEVVEIPLDDCWARDSGPTFVHAEDGSVVAVDWVFNGWGAQEGAAWDNDRHLGVEMGGRYGHAVESSPLVQEGGGIHVDGHGTVLLTRTVQLDPKRNPGWAQDKVEDELRRTLGATKFVWFERGLVRDYFPLGTRGHVDVLAVFASPDVVLYHDQRNPAHPDHEVSAEIRAVLEAAGDWTLVPVPAPDALSDEVGWVDCSYINHYAVNGGVILCAFDDPGDERAAEIMREVYPGREVVLVDARPIFARGGGVHCITQQQPSAR